MTSSGSSTNPGDVRDQFVGADGVARVGESGQNVISSEKRVVFSDFLDRLAGSKLFEDDLDRQPRASDTGLPSMTAGLISTLPSNSSNMDLFYVVWRDADAHEFEVIDYH